MIPDIHPDYEKRLAKAYDDHIAGAGLDVVTVKHKIVPDDVITMMCMEAKDG